MKRHLLLALALCLVAWTGPAAAQTTPTASSVQQNGFSRTLAADNDQVFVGETQNIHTPGRVYVYEQGNDDSWTESTYLEAEDGAVGDGFGSAFDVEDGTLVVGAPAANAAYVFQSDGGEWVQTARIVSADSTTELGTSVALEGDQLFVSAATSSPRSERANVEKDVEDTQQGPETAVHVFERQTEGEWDESTVLRSENVQAEGRFGATLLASDEHLLVGAPRHQGGAVFAFRQDDDGWTETQTLSVGALGNSAQFGSSLEEADGRVLVGAPRAYDATGTVYAFAYDSNEQTWQNDGRFLPFAGTSRALFGQAIAYDGTDLWVGAPGTADQTGTLYRLQQQGDAWNQVHRVSHPQATERTGLGAALAANASIVAAGMPGDDYGAGSMGLYSKAENDWTQTDPIVPTTGEVLSAITGEEVPCSEGNASQFGCEGVDLQAFLPIDEIGGQRGINLNDIWGWTDPETGTEYALVGRTDGTAFVDVSDPNNPVYVGELPLTEGARVNSWRDIKVYEDHAYVVADNAGEHGMQIFDLTQLRDVSEAEMPVTFEESAHYDRINSAHNVVINKETGYAYIVGSSGGGQTCGGGLHMVNIQDPQNPSFEGCFADPSTGRAGTGYSHDAQCVVYEGPDEEYRGREICIGFNETAISVADVTDKENPEAISTASYPDHAYGHQGRFTEDQRYVYQNDELDELQGKVDQTRTLVWDLSDLDDPKLVNQLLLSEESSDHNLYVKDETMYQSNYKSGLRVFDIGDPENPQEVAHFDTEPYGENNPGFQGTWSNYPYFESGTIVVSGIGEGLFILSTSEPEL